MQVFKNRQNHFYAIRRFFRIHVSFPATVVVNNGKLTAKALVKIDRTKYDIRFRSKSFFENLGDKVIYDDFDLDIALVASAQ